MDTMAYHPNATDRGDDQDENDDSTIDEPSIPICK